MSSNGILTVIPYRPGHLDCIELRPHFNRRELVQQAFDEAYQRGGAIMETLLRGKRVLSIFGLTPLRPGVAEVWSVTSDLVKETPIAFHRTSLERLHYYERELNLRRVQMTVREDFVEGQAWAEALGFEREGLLRAFGPDGCNYFIYARLPNG